MKKAVSVLISLLIFSQISIAQIGKVGLNTTSPAAMFHVKDSSVVFTGALSLPGTPGKPPVSGAGARLMWYPDKAAFRVGHITGAQWNKDSTGLYSVAMGLNTKAMGYASVALGEQTSANGTNSIAMGELSTANAINSIALGYGAKALDNWATSIGKQTIASGETSTAIGGSAIASGTFAIAIGVGTKSSGYASVALGYGTFATNDYSTAMGDQSKASGVTSTSMGYGTHASGQYSNSMGFLSHSKSYASVALGRFNDTTSISSTSWNAADPLFIIGNGTAGLSSNAFTVLKNAKTGINTSNPLAMLHVKDSSVVFTGPSSLSGTPGSPPVSGVGSRMMWYSDKAALRVGGITGVQSTYWNKDSIGVYSIAMGLNTRAKGGSSFAMGNGTRASGASSFAIGNSSQATGDYSGAWGSGIAKGVYSTASGTSTASGLHSTAHGSSSLASGENSTSIGDESIASGLNAFASGLQSLAIGHTSTAMGSATRATGSNSTALGTGSLASGAESTSIGTLNKARGPISFAAGYNNTANGWGSTVVGIYNDSILAPQGIHTATTPLFIVGNGNSNGARSNALTILKSGNIGISTSSPGFLLNFPNATGDKISLYGNSGNHFGFGIQSSLLQIHTDNSAGDIAFGYGSSSSFTETMRIKGNGNVGIGTNAPDFMLDVAARMRLRSGGAAGTSPGIWFNEIDNSGVASFFGMLDNDHIGIYSGLVGVWFYRMNMLNGNLGLGVTPTEKLHVVGNGLFTGTVTASCGVLVCSDERFKTNIQTLTNSLSSVLMLRGIQYQWRKEEFPAKAFTDEHQIGFSAQELEKIYPEMVHTDQQGFKTVDYSRLTPVLVEAIKEQQELIDQQNTRIEHQQDQIDFLMKEVIELKEKSNSFVKREP